MALIACGGEDDSLNKSSPAAVPLENTISEVSVSKVGINGGYVSGRVTNYDTGAGLGNIKVFAGEHTTITDIDGRYSLSATPSTARLLVNFEGDGFAEHADVFYLNNESANHIFNVSLLPVDVSVRFNSAKQQTLTDDNSPASVRLPAGALVKEDGSVPDGEATLNLTIIDPSKNINLMPGEMVAALGGTTELALIESFGAITATFEDSTGNALNLKSGSVSTIRIPLSDKSGNPPSTIPLYYYNKATGLWVEEGTAVLLREEGDAFYEGKVGHFSTWNADALYDQVLINGCVEDVNGKRLSNVNVIAHGNDYLGSANTTTDTKGNFSVAAKASSSVQVFGFQFGMQTSPLNTSTNTTDEQLGQCLVSSEASITVKMSWATPAERDYGMYYDNENYWLSSELNGPEYENYTTYEYWDGKVSQSGSLLEFPFMEIFFDLSFPDTFGDELLVIVKFPLPGKYRYVVENSLSEYLPEEILPEINKHLVGFIPSERRISDSRVELNINGNITVFLPPPGEGGENVNWNTFPPLKEAPNVAWEVFEFVVASDGSFTVIPLNNWLPQTEWSGTPPPSP